MSAIQKDLFYDYQSYRPVPYALDAGSIEAAMIVNRKAVSKQALKGLQKAGVVSLGGEVDTTKIDRHFRNHLAVLTSSRHKQVIDLLFWWEEETMRLKKLLSERVELEALLAESSAEAMPTYRQLLDRVNAKIKAKPSERKSVIENDEDELIVRVRSGCLAAPHTSARHTEVLPAYCSREVYISAGCVSSA